MEVKELIEVVKGLDDTKLTEFLKGLGVYDENGQKAEVEEVKDAGVENTANLDKEIKEENNIAKEEEKNPSETKAEAHTEVEGDAGKVEEETAKPVDAEPPIERENAQEIKEAKDKLEKEEYGDAENTEKKPAADNAGDIDGIEGEAIPALERGKEPPPEDAEPAQAPAMPPPPPAPVLSDDGKPIPTDFESIISGLNAKVAALESEKAILQSKADKVDAAFGYAARPIESARVDNGLYDPSFNIKMHR